MSDEDAFLRAICESPADDTVRLALADWYEERAAPGDEARAGLIRQIEDPYTFPPGSPMRLTYKGREDLVIDVPAVHPDITWTIRRGFVCGVRAPHDAVLALAEEARLFAHCPIEWVGLSDRSPLRYPGGHHVWARGGGEREYELDPRVFAVLAGHPGVVARDDEAGLVSFPTEEEAALALSWALVNVGRGLAGLPPLDPVRPAGEVAPPPPHG
jgi:uncharacterized protein (TIGR02996 family)